MIQRIATVLIVLLWATTAIAQQIAIAPSGDTTGQTDAKAINAVLLHSKVVELGPGKFYVSKPVQVPGSGMLRGSGKATWLIGTNAKQPVVLLRHATMSTVTDLLIYGGKYCIEFESCKRLNINRVHCKKAKGHCIYGHGKSWVNWIHRTTVGEAGEDGLHVVSTPSDATGNCLSIVGLDAVGNGRNGLTWCGYGLSVSGMSHFEANGHAGIKVQTQDGRNAAAVNINGNYFESNGSAAMELETTGKTDVIVAVDIRGNRFTMRGGAVGIRAIGRAKSIHRLDIGTANWFYGGPETELPALVQATTRIE